MNWKFNRVALEHAEMLFNWRNNENVYRYFFTPEPVSRENHMKWMNKIVGDESVLFLVGSFQNTPVGTVRFDFEKDFSFAEVGIYLGPEFQGRGLGPQMLAEAEKVCREKFPSLKKIVARVVVQNAASEKMFEKNGYEKIFVQLEKKFES